MVIGFKEVKKLINDGKIEKVLIAKNATDEIKQDKTLTSIENEMFDGDQVKLAALAGKPFPVAVVGLLKK